MTEEILRDLIAEAEFPDSVEFRIPGHLERPYDAPAGWMCVYECMFTEFGMNFPLSPLFLQFAADRGVPTSQLTHGVVRHIVFTEALARAAGVVFDRLLFEHVTDLRASSREGNFKRFHTTMKYDIVFGDYRNKIHWWKKYFFFVKINRASVGKIKADQIRTEWVKSPGPSRRARPNGELKEKFRLLKELSHRLWPEVVAALEKKKQERKDKREGKNKSAIPATPISTKPSRSKKKSMGLRKRAAVPIDDVVVASEPAPKKKRVESPRLRDSPPSPLRSSSIASRTR
ncbi:unnamed protein product [Microthlaspi erraticum]|uniref:Uncharacterized protein n=1 Tax=Microthlaspi erraticum TaxID=1685480 RepID=A0A6D2HHZ5_9BRAS|nr:unnamed protein product [Microthlaspi erraticum]CAA7030268.1 unnamed protein product [Microthlaspi erraticum]